MDPKLSSALRHPHEDTDAWLDRIESLLSYNRDNRATKCPPTPYDAELKDLSADRHTYAMWWDFYVVTEAMNMSAGPGSRPEIVFGGPDDAGTVWVKLYRVMDPSTSFCPGNDCSVKADHPPLPVLGILDRVVWYHENLQQMLAFDTAYDYRRPDGPNAPRPIPSTRDLMGLNNAEPQGLNGSKASLEEKL